MFLEFRVPLRVYVAISLFVSFAIVHIQKSKLLQSGGALKGSLGRGALR